MNSRAQAASIPLRIVKSLSSLNELAAQFERDAKTARLLDEVGVSYELLRQSLHVRSRTAALAESLIEGKDAPFQAVQLDFRRSLGRLHLTCGILAIRLGDWGTAREHGMRAVHFDKQLEHRVLSLLVTADVSEDLD